MRPPSSVFMVCTMSSPDVLLAFEKLVRRYLNAPARLPVVQELTDAYKRGFRESGGTSGDAIDRFYRLRMTREYRILVTAGRGEGQSGFTNDGRLLVPGSWDGNVPLQKLRSKGFSKRKIRQGRRYIEYVERYKSLALRDMLETRVPASISLAQGIVESDAGSSNLAVNTNNHFGIKAHSGSSAREKIRSGRGGDLRDEEFLFEPPAVGVQRHIDDNTYDRFEVYDSVADSYRRHARLLTRPCEPGTVGCYSWIWQRYPVGSDHDISPAAVNYGRSSRIEPGDLYDGDTNVPYYAACAAGLKLSGYATNRHYHKLLSYIVDTYELWRIDVDLIRAATSRSRRGS